MFIDSHCHFNYLKDPLTAINQSVKNNVKSLIVPAVRQAEWQQLSDLQLVYKHHVFPVYGLHPLFIEQHKESDLKALEKILENQRPIAIGECGLDDAKSIHFEKQKQFFIRHIELAIEYNLPLIIHARKALEAVLQILKKYHNLRFVIHSFTGSDQQLSLILELGGYIGIGGTSTYPRAKRLREQLGNIDERRYLLETDAPDQPLYGYQGLENTPEKICLIAENLAKLRKQTIRDIEQQSTENCQRFFNYLFN